MLVAIIIVIIIRFRNCGNEYDLKSYEDDGLSLSAARCISNEADKITSEPNSNVNGSVESLEEKNPDIIPQSDNEECYQNNKHSFVVVNNAPPLRNYVAIQTPVVMGLEQSNHYDNLRIVSQVNCAHETN